MIRSKKQAPVNSELHAKIAAILANCRIGGVGLCGKSTNDKAKAILKLISS